MKKRYLMKIMFTILYTVFLGFFHMGYLMFNFIDVVSHRGYLVLCYCNAYLRCEGYRVNFGLRRPAAHSVGVMSPVEEMQHVAEGMRPRKLVSAEKLQTLRFGKSLALAILLLLMCDLVFTGLIYMLDFCWMNKQGLVNFFFQNPTLLVATILLGLFLAGSVKPYFFCIKKVFVNFILHPFVMQLMNKVFAIIKSGSSVFNKRMWWGSFGVIILLIVFIFERVSDKILWFFCVNWNILAILGKYNNIMEFVINPKNYIRPGLDADPWLVTTWKELTCMHHKMVYQKTLLVELTDAHGRPVYDWLNPKLLHSTRPGFHTLNEMWDFTWSPLKVYWLPIEFMLVCFLMLLLMWFIAFSRACITSSLVFFPVQNPEVKYGFWFPFFCLMYLVMRVGLYTLNYFYRWFWPDNVLHQYLIAYCKPMRDLAGKMPSHFCVLDIMEIDKVYVYWVFWWGPTTMALFFFVWSSMLVCDYMCYSYKTEVPFLYFLSGCLSYSFLLFMIWVQSMFVKKFGIFFLWMCAFYADLHGITWFITDDLWWSMEHPNIKILEYVKWG